MGHYSFYVWTSYAMALGVFSLMLFGICQHRRNAIATLKRYWKKNSHE